MQKRIVLLLAAAALLPAQQPPKQRDLEIVKKAGPPPVVEKKPVGIPRSYALVIGVGGYPNLSERMQLPFAEPDAEAIFKILISSEGGNFKAENVRKLVGPTATLAKIREMLEVWLPSVAKDDDRVLVYFAGHGFVEDGKAYIAPVDVHPKKLGATGYPMDKLGSVFANRIKGKWKVLLTDSCHSGAITPEEIGTLNKSQFNLDKSLFVMTASRDREVSFESKDFGGGHGVFTYFVERGLGGHADADGDGIVTADELADYVRSNVRNATKNAQTPTSDKGSFDPKMLLAYVPSGIRPDAPPAPKEGTMILEANMDGVEAFIDGVSVGVLKKGTPLTLPGLKPGPHTVKGVRAGYEDDGPREETIYPGQESTVSLKIQTIRRRKKAATDEVDRGLKFYRDGGESNYKKAVEAFQKALALEPHYYEAAMYMGRAQNALFENGKAMEWFKQAIDWQPDYHVARVSYAGMLLDTGSTDESIRQLTTVTQRDKSNGEAYCMLAQAYRMKDDYPQALDAAENAVRLIPAKAESHFWLAESLRMMTKWELARKSYLDYLQLSNFDSKLAGQLDYWIKGFIIGGGKKTRASQRDIWNDLRSLAYFGICECEGKVGNLDAAIADCQRSIRYDAKDPSTIYKLGVLFAKKARSANSLEDLSTASKYMRSLVELNPDIKEAQEAKKMIADWGRLISDPGPDSAPTPNAGRKKSK